MLGYILKKGFATGDDCYLGGNIPGPMRGAAKGWKSKNIFAVVWQIDTDVCRRGNRLEAGHKRLWWMLRLLATRE